MIFMSEGLIKASFFRAKSRASSSRLLPSFSWVDRRFFDKNCLHAQTPDALVSPRMVDTGKLPGTAGEGVPREVLACESLVCESLMPRPMLCATKGRKGDCWDGNAVSIMSDGVRQDNSSPNIRIILPFLSVVEIMATFTLAISVFEPLGILFRGGSLSGRLVSIKVVIPSRLEAHYTKLCVSLCGTSGGDPLSRLVREFPVTANIKRTMYLLFKSLRTVIPSIVIKSSS